MIEEEVPVAPVLTHAEVLEDPQIRHNETILEAEHPVYGRYRRVKPSIRFSETAPETTPPAALYGEHTEEILDELGVSAADRTRLRNTNIIPG
jgi:crotonobetainyl-CoA:carnitine CoA-transferase CaiB-like acyl-CoA transferase